MLIRCVAMPVRPYARQVATMLEIEEEVLCAGDMFTVSDLGKDVTIHDINPGVELRFIVSAAEVAHLRQAGWEDYAGYGRQDDSAFRIVAQQVTHATVPLVGIGFMLCLLWLSLEFWYSQKYGIKPPSRT